MSEKEQPELSPKERSAQLKKEKKLAARAHRKLVLERALEGVDQNTGLAKPMRDHMKKRAEKELDDIAKEEKRSDD